MIPEAANERIRVRVEVLGHLRQLAAKKEFEVELTLPTIGGLISALTQAYGEDFRKAVVPTDTEGFLIYVLLNGTRLQRPSTILRNGDRVTIVPPVTGG
jgi:MoaD family protein